MLGARRAHANLPTRPPGQSPDVEPPSEWFGVYATNAELVAAREKRAAGAHRMRVETYRARIGELSRTYQRELAEVDGVTIKAIPQSRFDIEALVPRADVTAHTFITGAATPDAETDVGAWFDADHWPTAPRGYAYANTNVDDEASLVDAIEETLDASEGRTRKLFVTGHLGYDDGIGVQLSYGGGETAVLDAQSRSTSRRGPRSTSAPAT